MAAGDSLICPACAACNKPKWEFCARCGESLQGVAATKATPDAEAAVEPEATALPTTASSWVLSTVAIVVLAAAGVPAWRYARQASPSRPDPGLFAVPTRPSAPPSVSPTPMAEGPGAKDFEEGVRLAQQGKDTEALSFLSRAVDAAPNNARFRHAYAQSLWATKPRDQALAQYAEAARLEPGQYGYRLARVYEILGKNEEAIRAYEQVLALNTVDAAIHESLAGLLLKMKEFGKAVPHLEAATKGRPDLVFQQDLAYAVEMAGNAARAAEIYRGILERYPRAEIARDHLAELLDKGGRRGDAIALVQEGVKDSPQSALLHRRLGSLLERSGRTREAIAAYREYAKLAPNAPDAKELADRAARLEAKGS